MRIHVIQHVSFEEEAAIGAWAKAQGHSMTKTLLHQNGKLPPVGDFDRLVILGGPMSVNDEKEHPWLVEEKKLIREAIAKDKDILGVCLGAQLIADVLGARVYENPHKEVGWHEVSLTKEAAGSRVFSRLPKKFAAFHWHGETFDLPPGCVRMAQNEACLNQAFEYKDRVIGLQFHLESSETSIRRLIRNCPEDLTEGKYVQRTEDILSGMSHVGQAQELMTQILEGCHLPKGCLAKP